MKRNILIIFESAIDPQSGGVERVYHNLTPYLTKNNYNVYAVYRIKSEYDNNSVYTNSYTINETVDSPKYQKPLMDIVDKLFIDIIICPFSKSNLFRILSTQSKAKVIYHIHNVPSKLMNSSPRIIPNFLKDSIIDKIACNLRTHIKYSKSFNRITKKKSPIVLLSSSYTDNLLKLYNFKKENIKAIANPFNIDKSVTLKELNKEKIILYVGRISNKQKRITSLLKIWSIIQEQLPDYRLEIVGGGPEKEYFIQQAKSMNLKRITFHGFQEPKPFYRKADIFCMTSNYEGFPMVLVEAMQYGCIPFAFNSFSSIKDVIESGNNGFILPPFDDNQYANQIINYLSLSKDEKDVIRENAINDSKKFEVNTIGEKWIQLFNELL